MSRSKSPSGHVLTGRRGGAQNKSPRKAVNAVSEESGSVCAQSTARWRIALGSGVSVLLLTLACTAPECQHDPPLLLAPLTAAGGENDARAAALQYKAAKEAFYCGNTGGSWLEIVLVTAVSPASVASIQVAQLALAPARGPPTAVFFRSSVLLNFALVTWPLYWSFVCPPCAAHVSAFLVLSAALLAICRGMRVRAWDEGLRDVNRALSQPHKAFMTAYRSKMMLATCVAILAVDFHTFPRRLSKTETFGVSLMDAGVGSVLLSQAMVSPVSRRPLATAAYRLGAAATSVSPLLLLGGVRIAGTLAADYHTHVSEYGVHWNFFFTLAVLSLVGNALPLQGLQAGVAAAAIAAAYEVVLQQTELKTYILSAPRVDLLSANREGVFGCVGYSAVFFGGVSLGKLLFASVPSPSPRRWLHVCLQLFVGTFFFWAVAGFLDSWGLKVSRRLVNLSYVLWTFAYNLLLLALFLAAEILVHFVEMPGREEEEATTGLLTKEGAPDTHTHKHTHTSTHTHTHTLTHTVLSSRTRDAESCQMLCDAVNRNLLFIFLASNVMTGAVNMTLPTLTATRLQTHVIMSLYCLLVTCLAAELHRRKLTLKFW